HASWPKDEKIDHTALNDIDWTIDFITNIRSLRSEMNIPAAAKLNVCLKGANKESCCRADDFGNIICSLARLYNIEKVADNHEVTKDMVQSVFKETTILISLDGIVDFEAERARLNKELEKLDKDLEGYKRKLENPSFVDKAPPAVVEEEKRRQTEALDKKEKVLQALEKIA
ncbi:MAG: hypothetical protein LBL47_00295, partial [Lactobacillus sp.]|nr:hypothetical protein [Lactobacillus sp.]